MGSVSIGNIQLDQLLGGGIQQHKQTILVGQPGSGKTALALQFITDPNHMDDTCAYVCIDKKPEQLMEKAAIMNSSVIKAIENHTLKFVEISLHDWAKNQQIHELLLNIQLQLDALFHELNVSRLIIDSLLPHALASISNEKKQLFIQEFLKIIQPFNATCLCILYDVPCHEFLWLNTDLIYDQLLFERKTDFDYTTYWVEVSKNNPGNKNGQYRFTIDPTKGLLLKHRLC